MSQKRQSRIRIAIPGWRARPSKQEPSRPAIGCIDEFRRVFAADLKPFGPMDRRLSNTERRQAAHNARLRAALNQN